MKYPEVKNRTAVVTGASTGIGRATARLLRARGWTVWPTVRGRTDFELLESDGFEPVMLELTDEDSVAAAAREILKRGPLGAVVNNAGYGQPGALEDLSRNAFRKQLETNVTGMVDFTNRLIPALRQEGAGRVVLVSSVVGRAAIPFMGAYCASKFAVEAVGDVWRMELAGGGISVSIVEPGPIASGFRKRAWREAGSGVAKEGSVFASQYGRDWGQAERNFKRPTDVFRKGPEAVAAKIAHALESRRPRARYPVTGAAWLGVLAARWLPARWLDAVMTSKVIGRAGDGGGGGTPAEGWGKH